MNHSAVSYLTRNDSPGFLRAARASLLSFTRHWVVTTSFLTLICLASPCAGSEEEELSPPAVEASPESEVQSEVQVEPQPKIDAAPAPRKVWYGWQNLLVDGAGQTLAISIAALGADQDYGLVGLTTGVITYALGGPIVHFSHDNVGKGFASLGLRLALPPTAAGIGYAIDVSQCEPGPWSFCGLGGFILGLFIGTIGAIAIDAGALAYKKVPREETATRPWGVKSLVVLPSLSPDHAGLSVNGLF